MPLLLTTTPGSANAYADRLSVLAVAAYRGVSGSVFLDLTEDQQIAAIATTAAEIDSFVVSAASLAGASVFPPSMVRANQELAIARAAAFGDNATGDPLTPVVRTIKRDKTGPLETEFFAPTVTDPASVQALPPVVQRLIDPWLRRQIPLPVPGYGQSVAVRGS
jgi:hypothetical protein